MTPRVRRMSAVMRLREHVVHVGAGVGYYTAILAQLVGHLGTVTAIELDPQLAARAAANLARSPNVDVLQGDGASIPFAPFGSSAAIVCESLTSLSVKSGVSKSSVP